VLLLAAMVTTASAEPRQPAPDAINRAFSIDISAAQDMVKSGSAVTVRSVVKNVSDEKIWVVSLGEDVTYHVWDSRGFSLPRAKNKGEPARLQLRLDKHGQQVVVPCAPTRGVWFPVQPGQTVEDDFVVSDLYNLARPGTYMIQAARFDPESHEAVKSNTITIKVIP